MFSSENAQFEDHVDALLSFLRSTSRIAKVNLNFKNLYLRSASKILSFFQDRPRVRHDSIG